MPQINTYGLTAEDFARCFMVTVTPNKMTCSKCGATPAVACEGVPHGVVHTERIQALYDQCKNVMRISRNVANKECIEDNWVEIYKD